MSKKVLIITKVHERVEYQILGKIEIKFLRCLIKIIGEKLNLGGQQICYYKRSLNY